MVFFECELTLDINFRLWAASSRSLACSCLTITCLFHSAMGRPFSSWVGTSESISDRLASSVGNTTILLCDSQREIKKERWVDLRVNVTQGSKCNKYEGADVKRGGIIDYSLSSEDRRHAGVFEANNMLHITRKLLLRFRWSSQMEVPHDCFNDKQDERNYYFCRPPSTPPSSCVSDHVLIIFTQCD